MKSFEFTLLTTAAPTRDDGCNHQAQAKAANQATNKGKTGLLKKEQADAETENHAPSYSPSAFVCWLVIVTHFSPFSCTRVEKLTWARLIHGLFDL